jgi:hypothetical protein
LRPYRLGLLEEQAQAWVPELIPVLVFGVNDFDETLPGPREWDATAYKTLASPPLTGELSGRVSRSDPM